MYTKAQYEKELAYHLQLFKEKIIQLESSYSAKLTEYKQKIKEFWEANREDKETLNEINYIPSLPEDSSSVYRKASINPYFLHCSDEHQVYFYISDHQIRLSNILPYTDNKASWLRFNWLEKNSISFREWKIEIEALDNKKSEDKKTGISNISHSLKVEQDEIMRSDEKGVTLIHWVAGSGKTNILLHRIDYLIHEKNITPSDILLLCYNSALKKYLAHALGGIVFEKMPVVDSFIHWVLNMIQNSDFKYSKSTKQWYIRNSQHSFIYKKDLKELYNIKFDDLDEFVKQNKDFFSLNRKYIKVEKEKILICFRDYWQEHLFLFLKRKYNLTVQAEEIYESSLVWLWMVYTVQKMLLQEYKAPQIFSLWPIYKHILVDEFQDFSSAYIKFAKIFSTSGVTLAWDVTQSIFLDPYSWDIREWYKPDRMYTLTLTHRSTEESIKFANAFLQKKKNYIQSEQSTRKGEKPLIAFCKSHTSFIKLLENAMKKYSDSNFMVCTPNKNFLKNLTELVLDNKYLEEHADTHLDKDWDFNKRLHIAPFQAVKWLEFDYVFLRWIEHFLSTGLFWNKENQLYTVLTRARKRVIIPIFDKSVLKYIESRIDTQLYEYVEYE